MPGLCAEHGLCVLVENGEEGLLFDTGQTGCFLNNARILNVDLTRFEKVVLSHGHYDHVGGLSQLSDIVRPIVYAHPEIFRRRYAGGDGRLRYIGIETREFYEQKGVRFILNDKPQGVIRHVYTTGFEEMVTGFETVDKGFIRETKTGYEKDDVPDDMSLVLDTVKGLFILFGCAHRGIINIIRQSEKRFGKRVFGFMGGTHLGPADENQLCRTIEVLKTMDLAIVAPLHCTGDVVTTRFKAEFKDAFVAANGGTSLEIG
jgi:7,8-dihydropterin-6-yl-methyl-4-(beta-D-ribofuranosyl)aminobenzene 5'-phosphate synthase